jgi:hypothetical protein
MDLVHYLLPPTCAGIGGGLVAVMALLATNTAGLQDLVLHTRGGWIGLFLLTLGFSITFGSAAMGAAVMRLGIHPDD